MQPANDLVGDLSTYVWYVGLIMIVAAGLFFLYKFKGLQVRRLGEQLRLIRPANQKTDAGTSRISSFQAFCVGLGDRIGVGNITGVATAILLGGPGAIFWMWIFALIGACTSFVECTLGQLFKERKSDGQFHGGPAYYIKNGLKNHRFAVFMAFGIIITYGIGITANQAANASGAFETLAPDSSVLPIVLAVAFAALTAFLVFGGVVRVAKASQWMVPAMAVSWMVFALIAIAINWRNIDDAFILIITDAFDFSKIAAGFMGSCVMWGVKRGVFSNEAGIGSIAVIASSAHVDHPVHQGYIQSVGVLIDTLVVCSASAFLILTVFPEGLNAPGLSFTADGCIRIIQDSLSLSFGLEVGAINWAAVILALFMFVFAFSSLVSLYSMSEANLRFIRDSPRAVFVLRVVVVAVVFVSCILPLSFIWNLSDLFMAVMAIMNIYVLFRLYKYVVACHDDYRKQKDAGVEAPVFSLETWDSQGLDTSGLTAWDRKQ